MAYELFCKVFVLLFEPPSVPLTATVSGPVPSTDEDVTQISPSSMVVVPVWLLAPLSVALPLPTLIRLLLEVTFPFHIQSVSFPIFQVLGPTEAPLLKAQPPPSVPLPASLPMWKVLPLFCTSTPSAMSIVPFGILPLMLSVKRSGESSSLDVGFTMPSNSEKSHWIGVRVAHQPVPFSVVQ